MHEVLVNRLGGLSLPRKSVVRLTDRPDMTLDVYRGRKTTVQQVQPVCLYMIQTSNKACVTLFNVIDRCIDSEIISTVNGVPLHIAFHYNLPIVLISLKYCEKDIKLQVIHSFNPFEKRKIFLKKGNSF